MNTRLVSLTTLTVALAHAAGCGMYETGMSWSTKAQSMPQTPVADPRPEAGPLRMEPLQVGPLHAQPVAAIVGIGDPQDPADDDAQPRQPVALRTAALRILTQAAESNHAQLRANAIEALQQAPEHLDAYVRRGLYDSNRGVRFVAAMTIGELEMEHLAELLEPLLNDESDSVQAAAIFGLKRCGRPVDLTPLGWMISSDDPEARANAIMVLGELGNRSAVPMIRLAVGRGMRRVNEARVKMVNLQIAETLVRLGEEQDIEVIRAALFAPSEQAEATALACMLCGRLDDQRVVANLVRLARRTGENQHPAEVRMAATWALARIEPAQATMDVPLEYLHNSHAQLRVQAALTLGEIGKVAALEHLGPMLSDASPLVQVAAASAIILIDMPAVTAGQRH